MKDHWKLQKEQSLKSQSFKENWRDESVQTKITMNNG